MVCADQGYDAPVGYSRFNTTPATTAIATAAPMPIQIAFMADPLGWYRSCPASAGRSPP